MPGGGYHWLSEKEGPPVCAWLNRAGWHCAVLRYRVQHRWPAPLLDTATPHHTAIPHHAATPPHDHAARPHASQHNNCQLREATQIQ
eukprot:gene651-3704_t